MTQINGTTLVFNPADADFSQEIDIGAGMIKVKADGTYSFTADASAIGAGSASGVFTVTDGDGDTATANIAFAVTDANVPSTGTASASVDDDGLTGGNAASTTNDLAVPTRDGDNNEATFAGTLGGSVGLDTPGHLQLRGPERDHGYGRHRDGELQLGGTNTLTATGPRGRAVHGSGHRSRNRRLHGDAGRQRAARSGGPDGENATDPVTALDLHASPMPTARS